MALWNLRTMAETEIEPKKSNLLPFFNKSQYVICSPVWRIVPRDCSAAKGPLRTNTLFIE